MVSILSPDATAAESRLGLYWILSALQLLELKTTSVGPEEKEGKKAQGLTSCFSNQSTERKSRPLRLSQSERSGWELQTAQAVLFIKHTPPN